MPESDEMPGTAEMAKVALLKREAHLFMLAPELAVFELFNTEASEDSRARVAKALLEHLSLWTPGGFLIDPVSRSLPVPCCLHTLIPCLIRCASYPWVRHRIKIRECQIIPEITPSLMAFLVKTTV